MSKPTKDLPIWLILFLAAVGFIGGLATIVWIEDGMWRNGALPTHGLQAVLGAVIAAVLFVLLGYWLRKD